MGAGAWKAVQQAGWLATLAPGSGVSIVALVRRQFGTDRVASVTLERAVVRPSTPTMGTRLDLRPEGVESSLEVVGVILLTESGRPTFLQPTVEVFTSWEPLARAQLTCASGWREVLES